jgi:hypothetical protein
LITECESCLLEAAWPLTLFAGPAGASRASQPSPLAGTLFIYSLIQAMTGAKWHNFVRAANISLRDLKQMRCARAEEVNSCQHYRS